MENELKEILLKLNKLASQLNSNTKIKVTIGKKNGKADSFLTINKDIEFKEITIDITNTNTIKL